MLRYFCFQRNKPIRTKLKQFATAAQFGSSVPNRLASQLTSDDWMQEDLRTNDPEAFAIIHKEKERQKSCIELIAAENFASAAVLQAVGSCFMNKTTEGYPGARYYGGSENIDDMEFLCQRRGLELFKLDSNEWGINVQPLSGSPANFQVYTAVIGPHGRIMGLDLPDGGHLTHGYMTEKRRVSATSLFFESMPYKIKPDTGLIDYDQLAENAKLFRPKIIIAGGSCYARLIDYQRMRKIADENGAYFLTDMAHIGGLVAAGVIPSPFEYSDIVTCTSQKTMRGPRAAMIFYRKGVRKVGKNGKPNEMYDLEGKINDAVFPGLQGSSHNYSTAGMAVCFKQAMSEKFVEYQKQVLLNAAHMASEMSNRGYNIVTGGTDTHLLLVDLRSKGTDGNRADKVLEAVGIAGNKNTCPGDKSAMKPSGIRLGTPAMTSRGFKESDFTKVVDFIDRGIELTIEIQDMVGGTKHKTREFEDYLHNNADVTRKIVDIRSEVEEFVSKFPMPGCKHSPI